MYVIVFSIYFYRSIKKMQGINLEEEPILTFKELERVAENLSYAQSKLSLLPPEASINANLISSNNKLNASLMLDQGFYKCRIIVKTSEAEEELTFNIESYPIPEFHSILSIICPLIPKIKFLSTHPQFVTSKITKDIIQDLRMCEEILTIRRHLTNVEVYPDWNSAFGEENPMKQNLFISVFPFRDALYVTVYHVKETDDPVCELHKSAEPFSFASKSVIRINGKNYLVLHSIVAKQSQQSLAQTLRWIRDSIDELETLTALKPNKLTDEQQQEQEQE
ncbi:hypothetical protein TRFO_03562 [Tritrichomonas foetus]|uniref:Uncharacterized protein n=1 Tax=Tritrichomonas foetus TaxID=1144522 RepID=A0A1J4KMM9_9EUKA|nr:hypothetical protein TRFO_03562 [Tritrichomonas foetus]|eukprot:OHT12561.1 hypothetical protein TRFO_03562 [Tritrichomonas foetus]